MQFSTQCKNLGAEYKQRLRNNKIRVLPNNRDLVRNFNFKFGGPDIISEHNDNSRIDWTEIPQRPSLAPDFYTGDAALRIPEQSKPRYKLFWPIRHGWFNEKDYTNSNLLFQDIATIIEEAIKIELGLARKQDWSQYGCVLVIPDIYERRYVVALLDILLLDLGFGKVCLQQESLSASFGAGFSLTCVVDIGSQKTSICCVDEGMCLEDTRMNVKYGGADITETFIKVMLRDHFPYADINLRRRYDFLLAEELKQQGCNMTILPGEKIDVVTRSFHLRAFGQDTRKYQFRVYEQGFVAPMVSFQRLHYINSTDNRQGSI